MLAPHLGHTPFLPAKKPFTLSFLWQAVQRNRMPILAIPGLAEIQSYLTPLYKDNPNCEATDLRRKSLRYKH